MTNENRNASSNQMDRLVTLILGRPWLELRAKVLRLSRNLRRALADEGMFEVLEHESQLEILDKMGRRARFYRGQRVRYLHNNINAYQDHARGDGKILIGYK